MAGDPERTLATLKSLGTAKIAGLVCNKKAAMTLRLDVEVAKENMQGALDALGLEPTAELLESLEIALRELRKQAALK